MPFYQGENALVPLPFQKLSTETVSVLTSALQPISCSAKLFYDIRSYIQHPFYSETLHKSAGEFSLIIFNTMLSSAHKFHTKIFNFVYA